MERFLMERKRSRSLKILIAQRKQKSKSFNEIRQNQKSSLQLLIKRRKTFIRISSLSNHR